MREKLCECENKFFGISYSDERIERCDFSGFDVIVFDEIYFQNPAKWALIWNFCLDNPDICSSNWRY